MNLKNNIDQLLARPVDRREFLKITGIVVLSVVGIGKVLQVLNLHSSGKQDLDGGWGHTSYGGPRR